MQAFRNWVIHHKWHGFIIVTILIKQHISITIIMIQLHWIVVVQTEEP